MNFFNLLKSEHKEVKTKLEELVNSEEIDREECEIVCQKLLLHMEMEEKYFYPVMEDFEETKDSLPARNNQAINPCTSAKRRVTSVNCRNSI